ncbi:hypothetical protein ABL78_7740 [Leptomonas seymouri]|uniref:J domain-containing protein n=1 Tax=Leptomonas seymouri TaxID=5684 RepID=A0A0N0P346_LEPSE|nr:hypothetical protein ABL78_7740 [Leptomonas seymouri]|eukprot:KPI83237.1 hypothetical protein ABL78_7740 [Leptomonas seymouri]
MLAFSVTLRRSVSARAVLGLSEGQSYTLSDIKKAYREKALRAHPDAGGNAEYFQQLQSSYEELLREQGISKGGTTTAASADDGHGSGFYSHPHAQWANDRRTHREYWQRTYEEELNMNTNERGSPEHPSNTHYRARSHRPTYGEGLGEAFSSASQAQHGRRANFSTYYFYRPYESDLRNPYRTGFTEEELRQAEREQRHGLLRRAARHAYLWSCLLLIAYMHERNNRVRRATEARERGYKDPEYWARLREEEEEAKRHHRRPLRLENHWLEAPVVLPVSPDTEEENGEAEAQGAKRTQERRQVALRPMGGAFRGGGGYAGGTHVVSFQGRPFTPNGIRGARNLPPVTAQAYANDVTYDASDVDWEEEAHD